MAGGDTWLWVGGTRPHDPPHWAYQYVVVNLKADPNFVSQLKCVEQEDLGDGKAVTLVRMFHPGKVQKDVVTEFASLDQHPELIVFEGNIERGSGVVEVRRGAGWQA